MSSVPAVANNNLKFCVTCDTPGDKLLRCSTCKSSYYCNVSCQRAHWKIHKKSCQEIAALQEKVDDGETIIRVEALEKHKKIPDEVAQKLKHRRELGLLELRQGNKRVAMQHFKLAAFTAKGRYVIPHLIEGYKTGLVTKSELAESVYSCFYWKGKEWKDKLDSYALDDIEAFVKEESQMFDSLDCMNSGMDPIEAFMKAYPGMASQARVIETPFTSHTNDNASSMEHPRALVFEIAALVGGLSTLFLTRVPLDPDDNDAETNDGTTKNNSEEFVISKPSTVAIGDKDVAKTMGKVLLKLLELSHTLDLKLVSLIRTKMALNNKKYPASLCRGKAGKYTKYSAVTGITKDAGQSTLDVNADNDNNSDNYIETETVQDFLASLEQVTVDLDDFATERLWYRYHKPRNLLLALLGELGELAELFQWRGDHAPIDSITKEEMDKIGQELADVSIYLIRLSDVSHINLKTQAESIIAESR